VGKYESFAFLIDMNRLFEEFIREYLKQSLKCHGYTVEPGSIYLDEKEKIHLIPDIVISKNGSPIFIVDTKYKTLDDKNDAVLPDI
jgi:5-methylcytosine-specific restriction enzyme subunit McrC